MTDPLDHATTSSMPNQSDSKFISPFHILLQMALAVLFFFANELDRIFNLWLLLIPVIGIPTIIIGVAWIVAIFRNLIQGKWIRLASVVIAPLIVWSIYIGLQRSGIDSHWVRFQFNKSSYESTVHALGSPHPQHYSWEWGSTGGAAVVNIFYILVYDETDQVALRESEKSEGGDTSVKNYGNHFYLVTRVYQ